MKEVNEYMDILIKGLYLAYGETHIKINLHKNGYDYQAKEKKEDLFKHMQIMLSFAIKILNDKKFDKKEIEILKEYIKIMEMIISAKEIEK